MSLLRATSNNKTELIAGIVDKTIDSKCVLEVHKGAGIQSFTNAMYQKVNLSVIEVETHYASFDIVNSIFKAPVTGLYKIHSQVELGNLNSTRRLVNRLIINDNPVRYGITSGFTPSGAVSLTSLHYLTEGDLIYVEAKVDGQNAEIPSNNISTHLIIEQI